VACRLWARGPRDEQRKANLDCLEYQFAAAYDYEAAKEHGEDRSPVLQAVDFVDPIGPSMRIYSVCRAKAVGRKCGCARSDGKNGRGHDVEARWRGDGPAALILADGDRVELVKEQGLRVITWTEFLPIRNMLMDSFETGRPTKVPRTQAMHASVVY